MVAIVLGASIVAACAKGADGEITRPSAQPAQILEACRKHEYEKFQFVWLFGGAFPLPSNLVLKATVGKRFEYTDALHPAGPMYPSSSLIIGTVEDIAADWMHPGNIIRRERLLETANLTVDRVLFTPRSESTEDSFVLITDGSASVVLSGRIENAWSELLECRDLIGEPQSGTP